MNLTPANNWKTADLKDVIDLIIDHRGLTPLKLGGNWVHSGYRALSAKNIKTGQIIQDGPVRFIDENLYKRWMPVEIERGDILLTSEGPLGEYFLWDSEEKIVLSQRLFGIRTNKKILDPKFFYYLLGTPFYKGELFGRATGTTVEGIKQSELLKTKVIFPESLDEQREIAAILGSLDDKIELLRAQNKTLESIAQTLFKEWFVDFNFPGYEGVKVIDGVPEGWKTFSLFELVQVINGYSYKGSELKGKSNEALVTLKSFDRNGGFQTRGFKPFSGNPKPEQEVFVGDLVVAHTDLTQDAEVLGNPAFIFENGGFEKMYITMDLVKINSKIKQIKPPFLYFLMQTPKFKSHCVGYSNGTTVLHLSKKAIPEYRIILPEDLEFCEKFSDFAEQLTKKISNNISEIQTLSRLRDDLLNKIFS